MRTGHHSVYRGKRVKVFIRGGEKFIAKFRENTGKYIHFFDHDKVHVGQVNTISIVKGHASQ